MVGKVSHASTMLCPSTRMQPRLYAVASDESGTRRHSGKAVRMKLMVRKRCGTEPPSMASVKKRRALSGTQPGGSAVARNPSTNITYTSATRCRMCCTPCTSTARGDAAKLRTCDMEEWSQRLMRAGQKTEPYHVGHRIAPALRPLWICKYVRTIMLCVVIEKIPLSCRYFRSEARKKLLSVVSTRSVANIVMVITFAFVSEPGSLHAGSVSCRPIRRSWMRNETRRPQGRVAEWLTVRCTASE